MAPRGAQQGLRGGSWWFKKGPRGVPEGPNNAPRRVPRALLDGNRTQFRSQVSHGASQDPPEALRDRFWVPFGLSERTPGSPNRPARLAGTNRGSPMAPHRWHRSGEEFSYFSIRRGTHAPMAPLKAENTDPENPYICHSPASEWRGTSLEPGLVPK